MASSVKECPSCAMEIQKNSNVCPICGYEFPSRSRNNLAIIVAILFILLFLVSFLSGSIFY